MSVLVVQPGLLTTVQDTGRPGWRHLGVGLAGALDPGAAAVANRLVGNAGGEAVLEFTLQGPTLRFESPVRLAQCGAAVHMTFEPDAGAALDVPCGRPALLPRGVLRVGAIRRGARGWLAFGGGLDVPCVLGSRSTDLRGGFGGLDGRALRAGDRLALRLLRPARCTSPRIPAWWVQPGEDPDGPIRIVPTPIAAGIDLTRLSWKVSARSDRQGLRLEGEALAVDAGEQISAPVAPGTVQLPPDGRPIVLLADAQTVGGYPRLGHVIAADLPRLAQMRPGDTVRLAACDARTATQLACAARARLARIALMIDSTLDRGHGE